MMRCVVVATLATALAVPPLEASYAIYVGKNLTADGSVLLGGYGDEPSSHWLEIVPRRRHPPGAMVEVGATAAARYPGERIQIPQVAETARYITMNYSAFAGFPAPLTNGGLNEYQVAARDVWSPSRDELRRMTPNPQRGPTYSDLARIAMERARTARDAVEILGSLIDQFGYSTYGGNSHLFADPEEGWVFINFAGGKRLWVAERLGADDIRVSRPGYIGEIPRDYRQNQNYRGSANLIAFAVEQGWYDPKSGEPFNVNKIYGDGQMQHAAVAMMEQRLLEQRGKITLQHVMAAVRTPELTRDSAGYGQVAHLRSGVHPELGVLWTAASTPLTAPFMPFRIGVGDVPVEFRRHRYLTEGEAAQFIQPDTQGIESTRYAFRTFKRLFYLTMEHREAFLPEVSRAIDAFERKLIEESVTVERIAQRLFAADEPDLARAYLTYYTTSEALNGLRLGETLADSIEMRTKLQFGIPPASKP